MMSERKAEYTRTRTAKRKAEHDALVELAGNRKVRRQLAEKRNTRRSNHKIPSKNESGGEAGDPDGIRRYEAYLAKRREDYHKKNQSKEEISA
ncbi:MAG: hypothetical protein ACLRNW_07630 [Neglectibacter sp.]